MSTLNSIYLVIEAASKEGTEAGPGPAVYIDNKCDLDPVSLINKEKVVVRPEHKQEDLSQQSCVSAHVS